VASTYDVLIKLFPADPRAPGAVKGKGQPEQYSAEDYYYA